MADIQLTGVYSQIQRRFGVAGAGLTRFEEDFISAANSSIARINADADLETRIPPIGSTGDTVALDDAYVHVLLASITFEMCGLGQRPAKGDEANIDRLEARLPGLIDSIRSDIMNRAQDADVDDEESRVGLGALNASE